MAAAVHEARPAAFSVCGTGQPLHYLATESQVIDHLLLVGWRREIAAGEHTRARQDASALLDRLIAAGFPFQVIGGQRRFDPASLRLATELGLQGRDPFLHERVTLPKRANAERLAPRLPRTERFHDPRPISVIVRRELYPRGRKPGQPFIASMPMPVEEPSQRQLVFTPDATTGSVRIANGSLVARGPVDADGAIGFGVRIDGIGYQQTVDVDPDRLTPPVIDDALAPYLARDEGLMHVTPWVEALAARLARPNPWHTLHAFWDYFFDERKLGGFYYHALSAEDPLRDSTEWLDCYVGSSLLVAVARSCGIPARLVWGALMCPGTDEGLHYWVEAFLPPYGWVPFDLQCWFLSPGHRGARRWSEFSFGHLPYRLAFWRGPQPRFELGVQYPPRWFALTRIEGAGQLQTIYDIDTNEVVQRDAMEVRIGEPI